MYVFALKENGLFDRTVSTKTLKMFTEDIDLQYKNNFTSFARKLLNL